MLESGMKYNHDFLKKATFFTKILLLSKQECKSLKYYLQYDTQPKTLKLRGRFQRNNERNLWDLSNKRCGTVNFSILAFMYVDS